MRWSLQALQALSRRHLLPRFTDADAPLPSVAFEPAIFSLGCIELRLRPGDERLDFSACISASGRARRGLAGAVADAPSVWPAGGGWARCRALLRDWSSPASPLYEASNCLWWEFDGGSEAPRPAQPFAIVRLAHPGATERDDAALAAHCVERLLGRPLPSESRALLSVCRRELPAGARILHAAAMPLRERSPVRVIVSLPLAEIPAYAARIGWPGGPAGRRRLAAIAEPLAGFPTNVSLHLDLLDGLGPKLGLDLYRPSSPDEDPAWKPLFERLAAERACSPEKRSAISGWPPRARERNAPSRIGLDRELALKLVVEPDEALEAKAYLAFAPRARSFVD